MLSAFFFISRAVLLRCHPITSDCKHHSFHRYFSSYINGAFFLKPKATNLQSHEPTASTTEPEVAPEPLPLSLSLRRWRSKKKEEPLSEEPWNGFLSSVHLVVRHLIVDLLLRGLSWCSRVVRLGLSTVRVTDPHTQHTRDLFIAWASSLEWKGK